MTGYDVSSHHATNLPEQIFHMQGMQMNFTVPFSGETSCIQAVGIKSVLLLVCAHAHIAPMRSPVGRSATDGVGK